MALALRCAGPAPVAALGGQPRRALCLRAGVCRGSGSCDHLEETVALPDEIELKEGLYELGRDAPADLILPIPTVSTRHAMLRIEKSDVSVTDLNSTNGTFLNDDELQPLRATKVPVGAEVVFGDMFLAKFELQERPDPTSA